jgi:hypothetical protein
MLLEGCDHDPKKNPMHLKGGGELRSGGETWTLEPLAIRTKPPNKAWGQVFIRNHGETEFFGSGWNVDVDTRLKEELDELSPEACKWDPDVWGR